MPDRILLRTPLYALHVGLGGRMAPFAGYELPVKYPGGIIAEHLRRAKHAGLFDVSHMGQAFLDGPITRRPRARWKRCCPGDLSAWRPGGSATPSSPTPTAVFSTT